VGKIIAMLFTILALVFSQTERWIYRYNNSFGNKDDEASSLVFGADSNLYIAGRSFGIDEDFIVISLSLKGQQRWVYRYDNGDYDRALSIIYGADGNIYAAGVSESRNASKNLTEDFVIISLTSKGQERWVYRKNKGKPYSLVYGADGNIYAGGTIKDSFTITSLTSQGQERWVYCYDGECAYSLVWGEDGNLYAAGQSYFNKISYYDFVVVSLTPNGKERWVYLYNYPGYDCAYSILYGKDNNIYATKSGKSWSSTQNNFTVISFTLDGKERWIYYDSIEKVNSLLFGGDGNIYAAETNISPLNLNEFPLGKSIISLNPNGKKRWIYQDSTDSFHSLVWGEDGNIYAIGTTSIISLTSNGDKRWIYNYYNMPESRYIGNGINSIIWGTDGNIYAAGFSINIKKFYDFLVISINPITIIKK
jgi:hypothetical protein